jgi:DNA-binding transcriptional regulator YbjK
MMDDNGESGLSRQDLKKIRTQRGLRAAAFELFDQHGYRAVSIDDIAAKANVSRTTFFNYFSSKEGVITDPDILDLAEFARTTEKVPQGQAWWPSVTAVLIESLINSKEWCEFKKRISVITPGMNHLFQKASGHYVAVLQVWLLKRVDQEQQEFAKVQLQVAMAVIETTYESWQLL